MNDVVGDADQHRFGSRTEEDEDVSLLTPENRSHLKEDIESAASTGHLPLIGVFIFKTSVEEKIAVLQPYFNVKTQNVFHRLLYSCVPNRYSELQRSYDLYGPLMIILTLASCLSLLSFGDRKRPAHLQGPRLLSALGVSIGFWFGASLVHFVLQRLLAPPSKFPLVHIMSLTGYGMWSFAVSVGISCMSASLFIPCWCIAVIPASVTLGLTYYWSSGCSRNRGAVLGVVLGLFHAFSALYIRYGGSVLRKFFLGRLGGHIFDDDDFQL